MLEPHAETFFAEVGRPVVARSADYPDGHSVRPHRHRRHQLLYGSTGVVLVERGPRGVGDAAATGDVDPGRRHP